jgi:hypothetical protein
VNPRSTEGPDRGNACYASAVFLTYCLEVIMLVSTIKKAALANQAPGADKTSESLVTNTPCKHLQLPEQCKKVSYLNKPSTMHMLQHKRSSRGLCP